ncbi:MAG: hypothetical protein GEU94_15100 [Micromonosporaceae bacterium]|nr:hypothetical protein [Micromonosporaceae bacterium]
MGEPEAAAVARQRHYLEWWQAGRCAICERRPQPGLKRQALVEDHDHGTGYDRGMLCHACNTAEGGSRKPVFRAYRWRHPTNILGVTIRWAGEDDDTKSYDVREAWYRTVIESCAQRHNRDDKLDTGTLGELMGPPPSTPRLAVA